MLMIKSTASDRIRDFSQVFRAEKVLRRLLNMYIWYHDCVMR